MTKAEVVAMLRADNPGCPQSELAMYADAWMVYREASENVATNGAIVAHPRTAAPIENPYCKVVAAQIRVMQSLKKVRRTDRLWS